MSRSRRNDSGLQQLHQELVSGFGVYLLLTDPDPGIGDCAAVKDGKYLDFKLAKCTDPRKLSSKTVSDRVPCSGGGAQSKVAKVIDGRFDKGLCENQELSQAYSQPAKTVCLQKV